MNISAFQVSVFIEEKSPKTKSIEFSFFHTIHWHENGNMCRKAVIEISKKMIT